MDVDVIGGGPGGAYAALLLKKDHPDWDVTVYERSPASTTYGWGIVLPEKIYPTLREQDEPTHDRIVERNTKWDPIDTFHRGELVRCGGHPYTSVLRTDLLGIVQGRCEDLGVDMRFETEVEDVAARAEEADLVVAADGVHSRTRERYADEFGTTLEDGRNRFSWFGTEKEFDALSHIYVENDDGLWHVGAYPGETSTFIVSCEPETWRAAGFDEASEEEYLAYLEDVFADHLDGHDLLSKEDRWRRFTTVRNETWSRGNVALLGDAAHTAHFTIGSGTRMAMEDAIGLRNALDAHPDDLDAALDAYEAERKPHVEALQRAARRSVDHFERVDRLANLPPVPFAMLYLTRTGHNTYERVRERDPSFVDAIDRWFAATARGVPEAEVADPGPPLGQPFTGREVTTPTRLVLAPSVGDGADGTPADDFVHQLAEAPTEDAGLLLAPSLDVAPGDEARGAADAPGLSADRHGDEWGAALDRVADRHGVPVGVHLRHDGAADVADADASDVRDAYVTATRRAADAGFDVLGVDLGPGTGLGRALTAASSDGSGASLERRLSTPLDVVEAVRDAWPDDRPLSVRLPAVGDALDEAAAMQAGRLLSAAGPDLFTVGSGSGHGVGVGDDADGLEQATMRTSKWLRAETGTPTLADVRAADADAVNTALASGRADLCTVGDGYAE